MPDHPARQQSKIKNHRSKVFLLAGPTGAGKTALALALAERLDAEIVGADAFQIYAGLSILTAQPSAADQARLPHHLIACVPITESFDAQRYAELARPVLGAIHARGKTALVVGGAGLYFRALLEGFAPAPPTDPTLRAELERMDLPPLVERLRAADPAAPALVDLKNKRRVSRAIELVEGSGRPLAEFRATIPALKHAPGVLLTRARDQLVRRIETNVRAMFAAGVIEEVRALENPRSKISPTASRAIGLAEIRAHLRGELTRAACEEKILIATRQYAKRQLTWFRRQTTFRTLDLTDFPHPSDALESALKATDAA